MSELYFPDTPDAIDGLIAALNAAAVPEGLAFERDVLDVDRPEDWGAVEFTGTVDEWADGHIIDQMLKLDIWAAVSDRAAQWKDLVEGVLRGYGDRLAWHMKERAYLHDLNKVVWKWEAQLWR